MSGSQIQLETDSALSHLPSSSPPVVQVDLHTFLPSRTGTLAPPPQLISPSPPKYSAECVMEGRLLFLVAHSFSLAMSYSLNLLTPQHGPRLTFSLPGTEGLPQTGVLGLRKCGHMKKN